MEQIFRRTPMPKCGFNKVVKHIFRIAFLKNTAAVSCFSDILARHTNITTGKGVNLSDAYAARCVHLSPQEKSAPRLPEGIVKCTHLAA